VQSTNDQNLVFRDEERGKQKWDQRFPLRQEEHQQSRENEDTRNDRIEYRPRYSAAVS
jgi:hypothetical protein